VINASDCMAGRAAAALQALLTGRIDRATNGRLPSLATARQREGWTRRVQRLLVVAVDSSISGRERVFGDDSTTKHIDRPSGRPHLATTATCNSYTISTYGMYSEHCELSRCRVDMLSTNAAVSTAAAAGGARLLTLTTSSLMLTVLIVSERSCSLDTN